MAFRSKASSYDDPPINGHEKPCYGSRLLPQVVDELAKSNPQRIYATLPLSSDMTEGFRDVTMLQVSQAVNKCAFWLEDTIGRSTTFETLSYIGLPDLRYAIIFLAAVKCGYKLLLPSVRNPTWMNISLLEQTKCTKFLFATEVLEKIQELQRQNENLSTFAVSSLEEMLYEYGKHYPYELEYPKVKWDPVLILHSSGSTGPPKPIQMNHATFAVVDNDRNLPTVQGRKNQSYGLWNFEGSGGRYYAAFPPFHLGGFVALIIIPIFSTTATVVLGPPDRPPTGFLASMIMNHCELRALFCPPSIFEQLIIEPHGVEQAKRLDFILYAGGPLSTSTGDLLSSITDVCQFFGSTETGGVSALVPSREDWAYLEWHPSYRVDMQPRGDETYEMVLHRDPQLEGIRGLSCNFPDVEDWYTRDLFRPHPTKPNLWRFHGRTDDIIVLSNGEKFNPSPSEAIIAGHRLISGAVIIGLARFQPALLVEARDGLKMSPEAIIEDIWPTVQRANAQAPGHGRVIRSMILVATTKRFERAGKGTVIRKMTEENLSPEIEKLYSEDRLEGLGSGLTLTQVNNLDTVKNFVRASIELSFPLPGLGEEDDLYVLGLDSLKIMEIVRILKAGTVGSGVHASFVSWLSIKTVYDNPTIQKLSRFIHESLSARDLSRQKSGSQGEGSQEEERIKKMDALIQKYTEDLPPTSPRIPQHFKATSLSVALSGSTGSLGTYILLKLLKDPHIKKIYCLNRSVDSRARQNERFAKLGLDCEFLRVDFVKVDYGESKLGLSDAQFGKLTSSVDIIIHNAWKVDFNHSLESFEPVHIRGVRNLIDWSSNSSRRPHILFLSSISSVGNWNQVHEGEPVVEKSVFNHSVVTKMGYAESKHVAECILNIASEKSGVPVSVLRVGQIAGPVSAPGSWNEDEWFPSLIKTSQSLGYLPNYISDADWIPVDIVATTVLDIVNFVVTTGESSIYNIVNPHSTEWRSVIGTVLQRLGPQVKIVPLSQWIEMLEEIDRNNASELSAKPAVKILDFYRAIEEQRKSSTGLHFNTTRATAASRSMSQFQAVNKEWMEIWLTQLGY